MNYGNEIRQHYYLPKTVIIAPKRSARPTSYKECMEVASPAKCVLCHNHEKAVFSIQDDDSWLIKSVCNPYGVISEFQADAFGFQEVVIESPKHITRFSDHSAGTIKTLLDVYANRSLALKAKPHIRYVSIFKNSGPHAGATLQHSHSQIYAFPFMPEKIYREITALEDYKKRYGRCAVCDIINSEVSDNIRVFYETSDVIAVCPFASEFPYEVLIIPKKHTTLFARTNDTTRFDIATILKAVANFLESASLDFNYYVNDMHHAGTHTYLRITPRVGAPKVLGGLELATDIIVNPISPERAAEEYRQHVRSLLPAQHYATAK